MPAETLKGSFQNAMLASHNFRGKIEKSFERLHYVEKNLVEFAKTLIVLEN
jgi:hypothetical protein